MSSKKLIDGFAVIFNQGKPMQPVTTPPDGAYALVPLPRAEKHDNLEMIVRKFAERACKGCQKDCGNCGCHSMKLRLEALDEEEEEEEDK